MSGEQRSALVRAPDVQAVDRAAAAHPPVSPEGAVRQRPADPDVLESQCDERWTRRNLAAEAAARFGGLSSLTAVLLGVDAVANLAALHAGRAVSTSTPVVG